MSVNTILKGAVVGALSGYAGVEAMSPVTTQILNQTSPADRAQEERVSPGVAYTIAAKDLASRVGSHLSDEQATQVGNVFHIGLGIAAGEMYVLLRRGFGWNPMLCGLVTAAVLWGGLDEGITPAMGWSAPNSDYPLATHIRGAIGHLTLGAATALMAEFLTWLQED